MFTPCRGAHPQQSVRTGGERIAPLHVRAGVCQLHAMHPRPSLRVLQTCKSRIQYVNYEQKQITSVNFVSLLAFHLSLLPLKGRGDALCTRHPQTDTVRNLRSLNKGPFKSVWHQRMRQKRRPAGPAARPPCDRRPSAHDRIASPSLQQHALASAPTSPGMHKDAISIAMHIRTRPHAAPLPPPSVMRVSPPNAQPACSHSARVQRNPGRLRLHRTPLAPPYLPH